MATNSFNLIELYSKVFNIKGVRFAIPATDGRAQGIFNQYDALQLPTLSRAKALSVLGTPIYEQITFSIPNRPDYTFPDWPLLDIAATKQIIKTPIKGRNGTVKEYIAIDDYQITIRGILINYDNEDYPEDLVEQLHDIFKQNTAMRVTTPVLNLLDINNIVITDLRLPEVEGYNNIQPFVIQALSDAPVELIIKDVPRQNRIIPGL